MLKSEFSLEVSILIIVVANLNEGREILGEKYRSRILRTGAPDYELRD